MMGILFKPELITLIRAGRKTQTRWLKLRGCFPGRVLYVKRQLLQPAREADAYIRVIGVRSEALRGISKLDVIAEGFDSRDEFRWVWDQLHTEAGTRWMDNPTVVVLKFEPISRDEAIGGGE